MQTTRPTPAQVAAWKRVFEAYRGTLTPNRKSGREVDAYLHAHYACKRVTARELHEVVHQNVMCNDHLREKLPAGTTPVVFTYLVGDVLVGIDRTSGFFQTECADMTKAAAIYDDLFAFRGLDEMDLNNPYLVAEYIRLTRGETGNATE